MGHSLDRSDKHGARRDTTFGFGSWADCLTRGVAPVCPAQFTYLVTYTAAANRLGNKPANSAMMRHVSLLISLCKVVSTLLIEADMCVSTLAIEADIRVSRQARSSRVARVGMIASKRVSRVSMTEF